MFCNIHEEMNNVMEFLVSVECACSVFFHQGDVLVLNSNSLWCKGFISVHVILSNKLYRTH